MAQRLGYDELAVEEEFGRMTRRLRQPQGKRRDASIVGLYMDALRHKDGSLTVAYEVAMPNSMFSDDQLVDLRYDDMARMLAFDKPSGTLVQFRYATSPDPGHAINSVIASRARAGNHVLAGLLQASNLDWLRTSGKLQPFRERSDTTHPAVTVSAHTTLTDAGWVVMRYNTSDPAAAVNTAPGTSVSLRYEQRRGEQPVFIFPSARRSPIQNLQRCNPQIFPAGSRFQ